MTTACTNHPEVESTHAAEMPSAVKQVDGSYSAMIDLCGPCAERIQSIGFKVTAELSPGGQKKEN